MKDRRKVRRKARRSDEEGVMSHHFILTKDQLPMPEPWSAKTYPTRTEAVLDAKGAAARLRDTITVTRVIKGGHWIDEVEVTDVSTFYLSTLQVAFTLLAGGMGGIVPGAPAPKGLRPLSVTRTFRAVTRPPRAALPAPPRRKVQPHQQGRPS